MVVMGMEYSAPRPDSARAAATSFVRSGFDSMMCLTYPYDAGDDDRWCQSLRFGRRRLDLSHDVHPARHSAERGEALPIEIPMTAEVERGLVADADEEARRR